MESNYNFTSTTNYNFNTNSNIPLSLNQKFPYEINVGDYDKKLDFENTNLYFYRNALDSNQDNDFKDKYDNKLKENNVLLKRLKELEIEIETINARIEETRNKLSRELENQKSLRKASEIESSNKLKNCIKNEIDSKQNFSNIEIKYSELNLTNNDLEKEAKELKESNELLKKNIENLNKVHEEQNNLKENYLTSEINQLKKENNFLRAKTNDEFKRIIDEKDRQIKTYETALDEMKNKSEDYERNNSLLKKQFLEFQISKDNELKERENKIKDNYSQDKEKILNEYKKKFQDFDNDKSNFYEKHSKMSEEFQSLTNELNN